MAGNSTYDQKKREEEFLQGYLNYTAERAMEDISNRYNKLATAIQLHVNDYSKRYSGENSAWRGDSAEYLDSVRTSKKNYDSESKYLKAMLSQYKDFYDVDTFKDLYTWFSDNDKVYNTMLAFAKNDNDYWSQFKNAGDYEFRQALSEKKDEETLKEIFNRMKNSYGSLNEFYKDIDYAEDYDLWFDYDPEQYTKNAERIAEIEQMFADEGMLEYTFKEAGADLQRMLGETPERDKLREELANLKKENNRFFKIAEPEAYQAQLDEQARLENMPEWERALYTAGDLISPVIYGGTRAVENLVELGPRAYIAMKDASNFLGSKTVESLMYGIPGAKEQNEKQKKEWEETKQKWTEELDYDWTAAQTGFTGAAQKGSYLYDLAPEVQQGMYDLGQGIGNMAPAIAASAVNPMLGQAVFFGSAAGGGAAEASAEGADATTALLYGLASGGAEMLTEKIGGNMFGQPTDFASSWVGKQLLKTGAGKYVNQGLGKAAYTFVSEGVEESIMDLISPGLKVGFDIGNAKEKYSHWEGGWEDVIKGIPKTFVVGGTVGSVIEGIYAGASAIENISAGKKSVGGLKGGVALNTVSTEMSHIADTLKAVEAVNQSATASQAQKNEYAIAANGTVLDSISKISAKVQALSEEQRVNMFEEVPVLRSYLNEDGSVRVELEHLMGLSSSIIADNTPSASIKSFAGKSNDEITSRIEKRLSTQIGNEAQRHKLATTISNIVQGKEFNGSAIKAVTGNKYALKVLNDYLGTKLTSNAKTQDVRLAVAERSGNNSAEGQAKKFAAILGLGENGTRGLASFVNNAKAVNVGNLAQAFNDVYRLGVRGADIDLARNPYLSMLNEEQMVLAYNYGIMDGALEKSEENSVEVSLDRDTAENVPKHNEGENGPGFLDEKKVDEAQSQVDAAKRNAKKKKGTVIYGGDRSKLSDMQKKSLDVLDKVAEALGVTFRIYESERVNGRFVYKMPDGVVKSANGWYDPKTSEIWLDINAGLNGEGTLIFTAAHELTHFIKQWSPAKFKIFADFLIEQYGEHGISIDELVQRRIDKKKKNGEDIDPDAAYEEVIADSCETFLRDSNAVEKIVDLSQKDASLAQKIKQFLRDMLKRLRELMNGMDPDSLEGKVVAEMTESLEQLHKLWTDALADAGEAYSGADADIHSHTDGDILYSERYSYETLVNKPDMKLTTINNVVQQKPTKSMRQTAVDTALKNAKAIGKIDSTGAVSVYVDDLGNDVILSKKSLGHGLDRRFSENLPATLQAGEILKNAIRINELSPKVKTANASYVLIGAAKSPNGDLSIVEFVVNEFTNEVASIDVLKSINTKKEAAVLNAPPPTNNSLRITASSISIAQLLDFVNRYFPDILPESVWRHYGHAVRPDGELGKSALFSDRDPDALTNREILANLLETEDMSPSEKGFLTKYKNKLSTIEAAEAEIAKMEAELKDLKKNGKKNSSRAITLEGKIETLKKEISRDERLILNLEATKPIRELLKRETDSAYKKAVAEGNNKLAEYKEKVKAHEERIKQERREMRERASDRRHSSEIRGKIKAFKDKLQNALQHPTDRQYIPGALAQAIIDVCELIDTDTELYRDDGSINKAQERREKTRERLRILRAEYNNIAKDADPLFAEEYDAAIAEYLEELESKFSGKSLNDMSRAELEEMYAILQSIDATLKEARKLIGEAEAADVYEAGNIIIEEQKDIAKKRKNGKRGAVKKLNDGVGNYSLSPMRRVLEICAYDKNSPLYKIFQQFEKGVRKAKFFKMEAKKSFESLMKNKAYDNAIYKADGGEIYTDSRGRKFGISKMQKMQAILSLEREAANKTTHHIDIGGLVFADMSELGKGKLKSAIDAEHSHEITGADAVRLIEQFKKELEGDSWAQDYMKAAREFFNVTAKNAINDTYMQLKHRILATEDAYIPFEVDQNSIYREINSEYQIQETISSYGMLKEKQGGASNPLIMTGLNNVLDRHIEQVGTIQGLAIPIRNFNKIWNVKSSDGSNKDVKTKIQEVAGDGAVKLIIQTVRDLQGDRPKSDKLDGVSRAYKKVKRNYIIATFYANVSVMLKQIGSMFSATAVIAYRSPVRMMGNLIYTFANSKKIAAEVDQYTATAWERRQGLSDAELQTLKTERRKTKAGKAFDNAGSYFMIKMDYTVALSLWKYAKQDVAKKTGLRGEELLKATAEYYDEVIETTQSMTDVLHRPEVQRGGGVGAELLGTFKTDLYQNAGNLRIAMGEFAQNRTQENAKKLVKTVSAVMTSAIWGSIVTSLAALARYKVDRYRDDEDDELTPESWFKVQGMDILQELMGYAIPLFGSEAFEAVLNLGAGKSLGNVVASAIPYDAVNDLYDSVCKLYPKIRDGEELTRSDYFKLIKDCGNVLGIPTSNLLRLWEAGTLHNEDLKNGELFSFEAGLKDPNPYRLYKAMLEGDKDKIEKASRKFKNDDAITKAIRGQLRERDPRVKEAAAALDGGDIRKWYEIYNEILDEGHFDGADIKAAIESESNSYSNKIKSAAQAKLDSDEEEYARILDEIFDRFETVFDEEKILDDIDAKQVEISEEAKEPKEPYSAYETSYMNDAFNLGDTELALEILDELLSNKTDYYLEMARYEAEKSGEKFSERKARKEAEKDAESSLQSSTTSYWKPKYVAAYEEGNREEMRRIKDILRKTGFYENVEETTNEWV